MSVAEGECVEWDQEETVRLLARCRDALAASDAGLFAVIRENVWACDEQNFGAMMRPIYDATLDALLPLLTDALDRARQQGEQRGAQRVIDAMSKPAPSLESLLAGTEFEAAAARLARGSDRKAADASWDTALDVDPPTGQPDQHEHGEENE